jgi:hypothetical protein
LKITLDSLNKVEDILLYNAPLNINNFIQYVYKDESGKRVIQGDIHKVIQEHIDICRDKNIKNCGILAPWGHGKTEQIIGRTLDEIGKNINIRIQIICNTDDNSTSRVSSIKSYIEHDPEYHAVYPHVLPSKIEWGKHKITVQRQSKAKDGTVESWGITTAGTGSRADLQIFDDPVDMRNAITNPALRQQVKDNFNNVWMSRLVPEGFRIYIATVWHEDDLTHELMRNKEWFFLIMKVAEDFSCIECESSFKGKFKISLWDAVWSKPALIQRYNEIGQRAFDRGYRQNAISDDDRTFPSSESIFDYNTPPGFTPAFWPRITGVDPFGQAVVIFTIALNPYSMQRVVVDVKRGKWQPNRAKAEIIDAAIKNKSQFVICENNAAQNAIVQWVGESLKGIPIIPFTTTSIKHHLELGLPSVEIEMANGLWTCPYQGIDELDSENSINIWRRELRSHPVAEAEDTIMAMWFAREGARFLLDGRIPSEEIVTEDEMGVESVKIGNY